MDNDRTFIKKLEGFSKAVYDGFVLKRHFWYGKLDGQSIAFCEHVDDDGLVKVYFKQDAEKWENFKVSKDTIKKIFPEVLIS